MRFFCKFLIIYFLTTICAIARPVAYPGGWAIMQHNDYRVNSLHVNYTLTGKDTVGVMSEYMRQNKFWFDNIQYTRVLQRWNQEDSQGNLYLKAGVGGAEINNDLKAGGFGGIEADWESRRYYVAYENSYTKIENKYSSFYQKARVGVAPYIGGYNDLNTWLILQIDHNPSGYKQNFVTTPVIRIFKNSYLAEFGVSSTKTILFNFMTIF